jgi:hypothetical protein
MKLEVEVQAEEDIGKAGREMLIVLGGDSRRPVAA